MAHRARTFRFRQSANFVVRWQRDGDLRVIAAPFLDGESPFILWTGETIVNVLPAVDTISEAFFANVGRVYERQFNGLSPEAQQTVQFPVVEFSVKVRGRVNLDTKVIVDGQAEARGRPVGLNGKPRDLRVAKSIAGLTAFTHPFMTIAKTADCFVGPWEIEGHPDPNCRWRWGRCQCIGQPCCPHIVRDTFGKCWNEKCAWGWLWMQCGCHRNRQIPCPTCDEGGPVEL